MNFYPLSIITFLFLRLSVIGAELILFSPPTLSHQSFFGKFTEETGIKTNVVYATKGLAQRLKAEVRIVLLMSF